MIWCWLLRKHVQRYVWTTDDLRQTLLAAYYARIVAAPAPSTEEESAYQRGFLDALATLALNYGVSQIPGVPPPSSGEHVRFSGNRR